MEDRRSGAASLPVMLVCFMAGIALSAFLPLSYLPGLVLSAVFLCVSLAAHHPASAARKSNAGRLTVACLALVFLFAGFSLARYRQAAPPGDISALSGAGPIIVRGAFEPGLSPGRDIVLRVIEAETEAGRLKTRGLIALRPVAHSLPLREGDIVEARVKIEPTGAPGASGYDRYLAGRGVRARAEVRPGETALAGWREPAPARRFASRARLLLARNISAKIPDEPQGSIFKAISFALDRPGPRAAETFRRAGIYHLLVVSGFHAGFMILVFYLLLSPWPLHPRVRAFLYLPLLAAYATLCDFSTPVVRACLMAGFYFLGQGLDRPARPLYALSLAAFLLLVLSPARLFEPGWQLTFGITACLVFSMKPLASRLSGRLPRWFSYALASSLVANLAALPLSAWHFGSAAILGLPANLVFVPLAAFSVMLVLPTLLPAWLGGALFARANWFLVTVLYRGAHWVAERPWAFREFEPGSLFALLSFLPAGLVMYGFSRLERK